MKGKIIGIVVLMLVATTVVSATNINVKENSRMTASSSDIEIKEVNPGNTPTGSWIVWDNVVGVRGAYGGVIVSQIGIDNSLFEAVADDFKLDTERVVDSLFWQGGYGYCQLAEGQKDYDWDWRVVFWNNNDTGMKPGSEIYNKTIPTSEITREFWYNYTNPLNGRTFWIANYSAMLPTPITFEGDTTYWITVFATGDYNVYPWGYWIRHNSSVGGVKLHEAVNKAPFFGYPDWTNLSTWVYDAQPCDMNYQLFGPQYATGIDIKGGLGVSAVIKNIGAADLTNVNWSITLDGKLIFIGKTKSNAIPSIAVGKSVTVKDFIFGFGKTGIAVTTGFATVNTTGTVFLFFVFGIKGG